MPNLRGIVRELKKQERRLAAELASIRTAISSLEFGSSGAPRPAIIETPNAASVASVRRRRKLSAEARARISAAQKRRWAKVRAEKK